MTIEVTNIAFTYQQKPFLHDLSFSVSAGEIVTLIGSSGSGKTTILQLLNGLVNPDTGQIKVCGEPQGNTHTSYMMQEPLLLPWRTALKNVTLTAELGSVKRDQEKQALSLLNDLGLTGFEHYYPHELSGGMQQRVALACVLLQQRPILLLDEPFASLDVSLREHFYVLLKRIRKQYGTTIFMVTHDFYDAVTLSDRILFLNQGKIEKAWSLSDETRNNAVLKGNILQEIRDSFMQLVSNPGERHECNVY